MYKFFFTLLALFFIVLNFLTPYSFAQSGNTTTLVFLGDVTLGYKFNDSFLKTKPTDYNPFENVMPYFKDALVIANLEGTFTNHTKKMPKKYLKYLNRQKKSGQMK